MIINHNMNAMNAHRNMGINNTAAGKSMEKLSSGLRINRAGDDAAGLAISEKMRGQIRGLDQASRNAQDGISMIQTAEGALNETHNILQRMRELSVQSANDTNTAEDRTAITEEINQLTTEISRIANETEFNGQTLLNGSLNAKFQIGANQDQTIDLAIGKMDAGSLGLTGGVKLEGTVDAKSLKDGSYKINGTNVEDAKGNSVGTVDLADGKITLANGDEIEMNHAVTDGTSFEVKDGKVTTTLAKGTDPDVSKLAAGEYRVSGTNLMNGDKLIGTIAGTTLTLEGGAGTVDMTKFGLVAGDLANTKTFTIGGVDVSTADKASAATTTLDDAINKVSAQRSKLGAVQNRLEHTTANLDNTSENLTAAESRIRDVDMAKEMLNYSKNNILNQAAQSMMAQAKSQPEGVLQLLR